MIDTYLDCNGVMNDTNLVWTRAKVMAASRLRQARRYRCVWRSLRADFVESACSFGAEHHISAWDLQVVCDQRADGSLL